MRWSYDNILSRLSAHKSDCWRGIAPSEVHIDYNPEPPIFAAKFANCHNHRNILAIANEDGKVKFFGMLNYSTIKMLISHFCLDRHPRYEHRK